MKRSSEMQSQMLAMRSKKGLSSNESRKIQNLETECNKRNAHLEGMKEMVLELPGLNATIQYFKTKFILFYKYEIDDNQNLVKKYDKAFIRKLLALIG